MDEARTARQDPGRREKIEAERDAERDAERRQERRVRLIIAGSAVAVVVIIVVSFILVKANTKKTVFSGAAHTAPTGSARPSAPPSAPPSVPPSVVSQVTSIPASVTDAVGTGGSQVLGKPMAVTSSGVPLTASGKPEMLYVGGEFCPYCAAERWAIIVALSRFGTFSGLKPIHSAAENGAGNAEPYPNTATWTFHGSSFTSRYLTFTPVEVETNIPDPSTGGYTALQPMTSAQTAVFNKYDAPPFVPSGDNGSFPFVDFGNKYVIVGASYSPQLLVNLMWSEIASALTKPSSPGAMAVVGTANYMTAAICKMTGNQPATACTSTVQHLQSQLVAPRH
ncbi:MAG TPA: DUF929 family protein [Streptosporangiaceae bacterium]